MWRDPPFSLSRVCVLVRANAFACGGAAVAHAQGMNKMIINHLGKIFVTSDTATIMRELEVDHAAARLLSMAAAMQEQEMGDGSNFVVCFGGTLVDKHEGVPVLRCSFFSLSLTLFFFPLLCCSSRAGRRRR